MPNFDTANRLLNMTVRLELPLVEIDPLGDLLLRVGGDRNDAKCFLVCSNTLSRVSPVFARMLNGPFAEGKGRKNIHSDLICVDDNQPDNLKHEHRPWTVDIPDDNPLAFDMFTRISHGLLNKIPRILSAEQLCELMLLTNYYDATHLLVPWIAAWLGGPGGKGLEFSSTIDALPKTLWISWEFGRMQAFEGTAKRMTAECSGAVFKDDGPLRGLPLPPDMIGKCLPARPRNFLLLLGQWLIRDALCRRNC